MSVAKFHDSPMRPFVIGGVEDMKDDDMLLQVSCHIYAFGGELLTAEEEDAHQAIVSLFCHVLPVMGKTFLREHFAEANLKCILALMSEDNVRASRQKAAAVQEEAEDASDGSSTSSFSHGKEDCKDEEGTESDDATSSSSSSSSKQSALSQRELVNVDAPIRMKDRIIGAACFDNTNTYEGAKILQVTLIGVRLKYQALKIGRRLLDTVLDWQVTGPYDLAITYADEGAISFFKHRGFTDDPFVTHAWSRALEPWESSTLMVRPPLPKAPLPSSGDYLDAWLFKRSQDLNDAFAYLRQVDAERLAFLKQNQALTRENERLKHQLRERNDEIDRLKRKLQAPNPSATFQATDTRTSLQQKEGEPTGTVQGETTKVTCAVSEIRASLERMLNDEAEVKKGLDPHHGRGDSGNSNGNGNSNHGNKTGGSESHVPAYVRHFDPVVKSIPSAIRLQPDAVWLNPEAAEYHQVLRELTAQDGSFGETWETVGICKAIPDQRDLTLRYREKAAVLSDGFMMMRMFFSGSSMMSQAAFRFGFAALPLQEEEQLSVEKFAFGQACYFTLVPSRALNIRTPQELAEPLQSLVLCMIALGNTESTIRQSRERKAPSPGYDAMLCGGRPQLGMPLPKDPRREAQEYLVFDGDRCLPMYLIIVKRRVVNT
jgi:hypothetical protein